MANVLQVNGLGKHFGKLIAVNDVSFTVAEGEIFGIAGPNGAGKTTLFNAVSCVPYRADEGTVLFRGERIDRRSGNVVCGLGLARTFQRECVFETLDVLQNVMVGAVFGRRGQARGAAHETAIEVLELVGYRGRLDSDVRRLALFDRKKLMLASALATRPLLLLLDEPAAGLNQVEVEQTAELIRTINSTGVAVVLIEHVLPLLLTVSGRIMILNQGTKLMEGPPDQVVSDERVIEAYLGKRGGHHDAAA